MQKLLKTSCIEGILISTTDISAVDFIKLKTEFQKNDKDAFFAVDLNDVRKKHVNWIHHLPRIKPFYAVKCNNDSYVLKLLAFLGCGFDCASKNEIKMILDLDVSPERIIFANPCKQSSHIKYAAEHGVKLMTFDNQDELHKIKAICPSAQLILRIFTDDSNASCRLSMKFGADLNVVSGLLQTAIDLKLNVVGVSFHVGGGQMNPGAFTNAIADAKKVFDIAENMNIKMHVLDIGGGFPGTDNSCDLFRDMCDSINKSIENYFSKDITVIAEPGRYFASSAFTLATSIIARKFVSLDNEDNLSADCHKIMYYINESIYGSFNCKFFDHNHPEPFPLTKSDSEAIQCSVWGATCDGLDLINHCILMPKQNIGDWLIWQNMGAYTISAATNFNGIPFGKPLYFVSVGNWNIIKRAYVREPKSFYSDKDVIDIDFAEPCQIAIH